MESPMTTPTPTEALAELAPGRRGVDDAHVQEAWSAAAQAAPVAEAKAPSSAKPALPPALVGMDLAELTATVTSLGEPAFRAKQLYEWIYKRRALAFEEMTSLSKSLRVKLQESFRLHPLRPVDRKPSGDGSAKLLFAMDDGRYVEGVLMPDHGRFTLCVSSQVGCAVDCKFCLTGLMGFQRNLTAGEIVSQALHAARDPLVRDEQALSVADGPPKPPLTNVVFMGMGEPLLNPRGVIGAIKLITDTGGHGMGMSPRRVTVSTSGVVPGIQKLAEANLGVRLAVSLNGTDDAQRERVMPINRTYNLATLLAALRAYPLDRGERMTFEYVLLAGENDSTDDAERLARLMRGLRCKVNLIPLNPDPALPYKRPTRPVVEAFQNVLLRHHLTVSVRWSKGLDVDAACGQLAGRWRPGEPATPAQ